MTSNSTTAFTVDLEIRPALREDLPAIVRLLADDPLGATREQYSDPLAPEYGAAFDAMCAQPGNELLVAVRAGHVIGCVQVTVTPGMSRMGMTPGQLEGVRVSATARGKGIGEQLVRVAIERARAQGCRLIQLTTDDARPDAKRFYERLGFVASHTGLKLSIEQD